VVRPGTGIGWKDWLSKCGSGQRISEYKSRFEEQLKVKGSAKKTTHEMGSEEKNQKEVSLPGVVHSIAMHLF